MLPKCTSSFLLYSRTRVLEDITSEQIQSFYEWLQIRPHKYKAGGLSEAYIYHHIYSLKVFFNYLEKIGKIKYNPISTMQFKQPKANSRQPLTRAEISQIFELAETPKEIAILHLFYSCGLRRSEAESLNTRDIHFKSSMLYVRNGKGSKRRAIPMTAKVVQELENYYLQKRADSRSTAKNHDAFIINNIGERMSGNSYNNILKSIVKRVQGENLEISLHHLRHSIATHLLENGLSIEYVRDFLGHSYLDATQVYVKVNKYQLRNL